MRKRKDVFAISPLKRNDDAGKYNEDLPNAGRGRRPHYVMCALAEGAIRVCRTARMDVRQLQRGAKEQKGRDEHNEQNADVRVRCPHFGSPSHNYHLLYRMILKAPILERLIAGMLRPL